MLFRAIYQRVCVYSRLHLLLRSAPVLLTRAREEPISEAARVFWITGLAGAGKTTIGRLLSERLRATGRPVVFLDGDTLRSVIASDLGYGSIDRKRSGMRNGKLCKVLAEDGVDVVCSTVSLVHKVHRWNRANIPGYREIYLRVPRDELERRDPKGLYSSIRSGRTTNVVGIDIEAQEPENPDLIIDNHGDLVPQQAIAIIWQRLVEPKATSPAGGAVAFAGKVKTLEQLAGNLKYGTILPLVRFTIRKWLSDRDTILARITGQGWGADPLIVRSGARSEDEAGASQAGKFKSIGDVTGPVALADAIESVIASYGVDQRADDQVFVQPMLREIALAGVAFSRDPNSGGPYIVINYDDRSGRADLVTSGTGGDLKTFYCHLTHRDRIPDRLRGVALLIEELETLLGQPALDIEFAVIKSGEVVLLQVRPLAMNLRMNVTLAAHENAVAEITQKIELLSRPHPYLHGKRTVFGVMPDWNPAEIVGLKPRPLALSLYRELVTDAVWAYQRDNYGYKNLRSFPLLISFHGLPYIDVRVSFNSFVPRDVKADLAERLVTHYINHLLSQPSLHDKVEFEIIFSCYTLDLPERLEALRGTGFSHDDLVQLAESLRTLTNRIIHSESGLWRKDRDKIDILSDRIPRLHQPGIDKISRIYWLLEDCKRYGTLPFAGLARAGFVAIQLLRSLVNVGILNESDHAAFLSNLDTIGSRISRDFAQMSKQDFLSHYGHLRPGTYDILSPRYDEDPDRYFDWAALRPPAPQVKRFAMSIEQMRRTEQLLNEHKLEQDALGLMEFIKAGIEGREYSKFVFTRSLSDAMAIIRQLGEEHGLSLEDCAHLDIAAIRSLYGESGAVGSALRTSAAEGRRRYELTRSLVLPPLITDPDDAWAFHLPPTQANFVTQKTVVGDVRTVDARPEQLAGSILFIPNADPGFDWIFTRGISGFVTQFGGVNSHMAVRAGELGIPAAIGTGEAMYKHWSSARRLCLDCATRQVQILA